MPHPADSAAGGATLLVCFAVKEEKAFFEGSAFYGVRSMVTGMGSGNAGVAIRRALHEEPRPALVITAGFAGGLNPKLVRGTVVFEADASFSLTEAIRELGATPVQFHCADRVAVTVGDKAALWNRTGADAVEMESSVIRAACREAGVPSATVRVISDAVDEDLPLDFNSLMTQDQRMNWPRFAGTLLKQPSLIPKLMVFQRQTRAAAGSLGTVLNGLVSRWAGR